MPSLKDLFTKAAFRGESTFDRVHQLVRERLQLNDKPQIVPYFGFGNPEQIQIRGRVLQAKKMSSIEAEDKQWENIWRAYQRVNSRELPFAQVTATFDGRSEKFTADDEGFFVATMPRGQRAPQPLEKIQLKLATLPEAPSAEGAIFTPHSQADFGVISDIDDTILLSKATNYAQAARLMLTQNFHTRLPFPGVAEFYQALTRGLGANPNPMFYVSSSPWNLFDMLTDFMELRDIPLGPLFLKDYGVTETMFLSSGHGLHKMAQINLLMTTYPELPFILIGDSGQHDPEIYSTVVEQFPGRVKAIYIRDVSDEHRDGEVQKIADQLTRDGVPMVFAADSFAAAEHAQSIGLIDALALEKIKNETTDNRPQASED